MKLSYKWLKDYIDLEVSPEELAKGLTMSGSEVGEMETVGNDTVMELEITTNRPDCLNMIGLAREASAVFDKDLKVPGTGSAEWDSAAGPEVKCVIENRDLCPRYTGRVITGVSIKRSGQAIRDRIAAVGLREVNNVVDITNFCLMELGQPLHAFDLDKVKGGKILVREAVEGEKIVTIDGVERELRPGMLVIADAERPIAVAGVMGGKETEITEQTKNVFLESAYFDPVSIRRTARALGLSSDSSYRFERGVDKNMILPASYRAAEFIEKEAAGTVCQLYDEGQVLPEEPEIVLDVEKAGQMLGVGLKKENVRKILERLGFKVIAGEETLFTVKVASFREDVRREIDLVEEIARIYGYHNIPAVVTKITPQIVRKDHARRVMEKTREMLFASGLSEIMTYSLISEKAVATFREISAEPVRLKCYLSEEHQFLTPHLLDGMLKTIAWNLNRNNRDLEFFEIGKVYRKNGEDGNFEEEPTLCIGLTGARRKDWKEGARDFNVFDLKGIVETLLKRLELETGYAPAGVGFLKTGVKIAIEKGVGTIGFGGEVRTEVLKEYDIDKPVFLMQISLGSILRQGCLDKRYQPIAKFPFSSRDISVLCDRTIHAGDIFKIIKESGEETVQEVDLLDAYTGENIPAGKISYTYTIKYGSPARTLTDDDIAVVHKRIKEEIQKAYNVKFR